jgi:MoxR-like ATPase
MLSISEVNDKIKHLQDNIEKVIVGKSDVIQKVLVALLARGHLLIEDVPGVGKTSLAQSLSKSLNLLFKRIQFTSDILPTDITGVSIYDQKDMEFKFRPGPLFANLVLADEINRAAPKAQSALLEAMNDNQVSVDNLTHKLPEPFMVIATQNPVEYHGTYPLPESQLDRFMMKIKMGYPSGSYEKKMLIERTNGLKKVTIDPVFNAGELIDMQKMVEKVKIEDSLINYMVSIITASRESKYLGLGVSPRGGLIFQQAVRAHALLEGRDYAIPDDFKDLAVPILAHRVIVDARKGSYQRRSEDAEIIIQEIVNSIPVPI